MSGKHAVTAMGRRMAPPVPDVTRADLPLVVPQRERLTYLTHLSGRFAVMPGLSTAFGCHGQEPALHVIAIGSEHAGGGPSRVRGVTVRCDYAHGAQWFVRGGDGTRFAVATELADAANIVRRAVETQEVPA